MNAAQVRQKARAAVKRREELIEEEEMESGELNLVPYLDIVTNIMLFLLATITSGLILGNINSALPEYAESAGMAANPDTQTEPPVQLVVAVTTAELIVFSISGQEGDINKPRARIKAIKAGELYDYDKLTEVVAEIVRRRWPDKASRPAKSTEVVLMADAEIPYYAIVSTMDSIRNDKDGTLLFPDVLFSMGIQ